MIITLTNPAAVATGIAGFAFGFLIGYLIGLWRGEE